MRKVRKLIRARKGAQTKKRSTNFFPGGAAPPRKRAPQGQGPRQNISENLMIFKDFLMGALALGALLRGVRGGAAPPRGENKKFVFVLLVGP